MDPVGFIEKNELSLWPEREYQHKDSYRVKSWVIQCTKPFKQITKPTLDEALRAMALFLAEQ